jgi:hypothetical protein
MPPPASERATSAKAAPKSQTEAVASTKESDTAPISFQARNLRRLFNLCQATARTIATLAYGVAR